MKGVVVKSVGDLYNVKINNNIIRCNYRGKNKLKNEFSNPIVSGDKVEIKLLDEKSGIIEKVIERKNYFIKKSLKDKKAHIIGANVDQILIISSIICIPGQCALAVLSRGAGYHARQCFLAVLPKERTIIVV